MTVYIVSGWMRSGTSMVMDALSAGGREKGLRVAWSRKRDAALNKRFGDEDFLPNECYREVSLQEYQDLDFPLKYDECLIKVMGWGLQQMQHIDHRIVYMRRDPLEVAESHARSLGHWPTFVCGGVRLSAERSPTQWRRWYERMTSRTIAAARAQPDCLSLDVWDYAEVIEDPLKHFEALAGWPIDPETAAAVVDRSRKRVVVG